MINNPGSEGTPLPTCGWCHGASRVSVEPLFLWMRQVIRFANDSHPVFSLRYIYIDTGCGGKYLCVRVHVDACVRVGYAYACVRTLLLHLLCESVCEKHVSPRTAVFLPQQWSHPVGAQADVSCLFQSSAFVCMCVCVCVFFCRGGEHRLVGASCLPSGSKVCVFPTNLQHTAKPKTTLPASV